jgi:hypothetical protein
LKKQQQDRERCEGHGDDYQRMKEVHFLLVLALAGLMNRCFDRAKSLI